MSKKSPLIALPLLALAHIAAAAGQAEICYTTAQENPPPPTNASVFNCPTIGNKTLPQIAALGWQVVQLGPIVWNQTDPLHITQADQLIVQKP